MIRSMIAYRILYLILFRVQLIYNTNVSDRKWKMCATSYLIDLSDNFIGELLNYSNTRHLNENDISWSQCFFSPFGF